MIFQRMQFDGKCEHDNERLLRQEGYVFCKLERTNDLFMRWEWQELFHNRAQKRTWIMNDEHY